MTGALESVLEFYRELPFNITASSEVCADLIIKQNVVTGIYPFENDLYYAENITEIGCGTGWLSNSLAYYYPTKVTSVDFNPMAIQVARKTAEFLFGNNTSSISFVCDDLFRFDCPQADIVISNGVLHHTSDPGGIKRCIALTRPGGRVFLGLYHLYGRKPFLDYFAKLKSENDDEDFLFSKYRELDHRHDDSQQSRSWFLDQVMHPHESQHTLKEVMEIFTACGIRLIATSLNQYEEFDSLEDLFKLEPYQYEIGQKMLQAGHYYPGFFYCLGEKIA